MAKRRKKIAKRTEYFHLSLSVEHFDAEVRAGINHYAREPQYAWNLDDRDSVYEFGCSVAVSAKLICPNDRVGETYQLTFYSADAPSHNLSATLQDLQTRDKNGIPQYREYRHKQVPVYAPPKGLAFVEKTRGELRWTAWIATSGRFLNDMLAILRLDRRLFMTIHERKEDRRSWIQSISLQTEDPTNE